MSLRFHWFLPATGDVRDIGGGGHGLATGTVGTGGTGGGSREKAAS